MTTHANRFDSPEILGINQPDSVLLALLTLGAGAYLSTFPAQITRIIGIILMVAAVCGLALWFAWEYRRPAMTGYLLIATVVFAVLSALIPNLGDGDSSSLAIVQGI